MTDFQNYCLIISNNHDSRAISGQIEQPGVVTLDLLGNKLALLGVNCDSYNTGSLDHNCIATASNLSSSYSGVQHSHGRCGDYFVVSHKNKPQVSIYEWGKHAPIFSCHTQEIISSLSMDSAGQYLFAGTKRGLLYIWNLYSGELLGQYQIHFQNITKLICTQDSQFLVSSSDDGSCKLWKLYELIDISHSGSALLPYRSWNLHSLPVTDLVLLDGVGMLRVFSCSADFSVALYDAFANKVVFKTSLHEAITTISFHIGLNTVFCGSSAGYLATFDLSVSVSPNVFSEDNSNQKFDAQYGIRKIRAHQSAITSLLLLPDNASLITSSSDGSLKFWNIFTLQFLRELFPFGKSPISNCLVLYRPEKQFSAITHPVSFPVSPLRKYVNSTSSSQLSTFTLGPANFKKTNIEFTGNWHLQDKTQHHVPKSYAEYLPL